MRRTMPFSIFLLLLLGLVALPPAPEAQACDPLPWGPDGALGAPDTANGTEGRAWAPEAPEAGEQWLRARFAAPVRAAAILVAESAGTGAWARASTIDGAGEEVVVWEGEDPLGSGADRGVAVLPLTPHREVAGVRIVLDTGRVSGWNALDAVGVLDAEGVPHWAVSADASSTRGAPPATLLLPPLTLEVVGSPVWNPSAPYTWAPGVISWQPQPLEPFPWGTALLEGRIRALEQALEEFRARLGEPVAPEPTGPGPVEADGSEAEGGDAEGVDEERTPPLLEDC